MNNVIDMTSRLLKRLLPPEDLQFMGLSEITSLDEIYSTWEFLAAAASRHRQSGAAHLWCTEERYRRLVDIGHRLKRALAARARA